MSWQDEKMNEKEMQKHEEKSAEEKSYEEKYRRDPLGTLIWAVILIWAGVVMLANNFGMLDRIRFRFADLPFDIPFIADAWPFIFLGAGVILLIEVLIWHRTGKLGCHLAADLDRDRCFDPTAGCNS
jgi:hypothetical protein